ncbi:hypothetical protein BJX96DRAFT_38661 [Aspergillus floccosus]
MLPAATRRGGRSQNLVVAIVLAGGEGSVHPEHQKEPIILQRPAAVTACGSEGELLEYTYKVRQCLVSWKPCTEKGNDRSL